MSDNELVIVIMSIIFGSGVAIVFIVQIAGLIKSFMNRGVTEETDELTEQLIEDYLAFKKHTQNRLRTIESKANIAVSPDNSAKERPTSPKQINQPQNEQSVQEDISEQKRRLKNMLREDRK